MVAGDCELYGIPAFRFLFLFLGNHIPELCIAGVKSICQLVKQVTIYILYLCMSIMVWMNHEFIFIKSEGTLKGGRKRAEEETWILD